MHLGQGRSNSPCREISKSLSGLLQKYVQAAGEVEGAWEPAEDACGRVGRRQRKAAGSTGQLTGEDGSGRPDA